MHACRRIGQTSVVRSAAVSIKHSGPQSALTASDSLPVAVDNADVSSLPAPAANTAVMLTSYLGRLLAKTASLLTRSHALNILDACPSICCALEASRASGSALRSKFSKSEEWLERYSTSRSDNSKVLTMVAD